MSDFNDPFAGGGSQPGGPPAIGGASQYVNSIPANAGPPKSKLTAGLLGLFLGALGIHNFYLGHKGKAITQLLITVLTIGYGAVITVPWALVEAIMILAGSKKTDAHGIPLA